MLPWQCEHNQKPFPNDSRFKPVEADLNVRSSMQEGVADLRDKLVLATGACSPSNVEILQGR